MGDDLKKLRSNFYRLILRAKPYRRRRSLFAGGVGEKGENDHFQTIGLNSGHRQISLSNENKTTENESLT